MKTIQHDGYIGSISAKVDRSVGYRINTPELSDEEKTILFSLQNQALKITLIPINDPEAVIIPVNETMHRKSQSQRLRSVIYVLWETKKSHNIEVPADFEDYYKQITEWLIEKVKSQIDELEA